MENKVNSQDEPMEAFVNHVQQLGNIILEHEKKIVVLDHRLSELEKAAADKRIVVLS